MTDVSTRSLDLHEKYKGKIAVISKIPIKSKEDLSLLYTPGVAAACKKIHENIEDAYKYTSKGNLIALISDGTAVLGLGDIGPGAAMPVMEGKSILFKEFGDVDTFPICLDTKDTEEIIKTIKYLAPSFGGINLEDISAPRCFDIEERLIQELNIPVFHDDQHGTAIVAAAGLMNALKIVGKKITETTIVVNGPGAAGTAIVKMLLDLGAQDIIICDKEGILFEGDPSLTGYKKELAAMTNRSKKQGHLGDALMGADVFIGVSVANALKEEMIPSMNENAIVFALANPIPEIDPVSAKRAGAKIVATGRSDYPNQVNNILAFPGIFRGALDVRASKINKEMKLAAAYAIADLVDENELKEDYIIPGPFDKRVVPAVAEAVAKAAHSTGVARI